MRMNSIFMKVLLTGFILGILISCQPPTEAPTTGTIEGTIYDGDSSEPLRGVTITTSPVTSSKTTDANGGYKIEGVEPGTYTLQAAKTGYHSSSTSIQVVAGETSSADLQLDPLGPELSVSTAALNFGTNSTSLTFTITNSGIGTLSWNVISTANWISVNPSNGSTESESDVVTVTIDRSAMDFGNYYETITISSNKNSKTLDVLMTIPNPNSPQLSVFPTTLDFGSNSNTEAFNVTNTGTGMLTWNITDNKSWISVSPQSGTTQTESDEITINIDRLGLSPGTYMGTITVSSDGGNQDVIVTTNIPDEPSLSVTPTVLEFGSTVTAQSFTIANAGSGTLNWDVSDNQDWISSSPTSGADYGTVNVYVSRDGLSPGDYTGLLTVSSNGGIGHVSVSMNVPTNQPPIAVILNNPTNITTSSMTLRWEVSYADDFKSYKLYRSTNSSLDENSQLVTELTNRYTHEYTDTNLSDGATYYYRVYVEDTIGQATGSNIVTATTINAPGSWGLFATLGTSLRGISVLRDDFVYTVGDSGKIYKWNGQVWTQVESPTTDALKGVSVISEDDIWIAGIGGVWHSSGTIWQQTNGAPTTSCFGIDFSGANDMWVAGEDVIHHFNGSAWSIMTFNTGNITDIKAFASDDVWAVSEEGEVLHFNGITWSELTDLPVGSDGFCSAIWGTTLNNYWIGGRGVNPDWYGYGYSISHWNGTSWDNYNRGYTSIYDIDGFAGNDIWFCGSGGHLYHWNGTDLNDIDNLVTETIYMITFSSASSGWAVGAGGIVMRYSD